MCFNRSRTNGIRYGLMIAFFIGVLNGQALAHRVTIFAWVEGNTVHTQSQFAGGKAVKNGDIIVYDSQGNQHLTGKTDAAGEFTFTRPGKTNLRVVLNAGMGHGNEWIISDDAIESESPLKPVLSPSTVPDELTREDIKLIVDRSIDNKLKLMMKLLVEMRTDSPSFTDVLGGLGYLFGLVGVGAYIHSRKKR